MACRTPLDNHLAGVDIQIQEKFFVTLNVKFAIDFFRPVLGMQGNGKNKQHEQGEGKLVLFHRSHLSVM